MIFCYNIDFYFHSRKCQSKIKCIKADTKNCRHVCHYLGLKVFQKVYKQYRTGPCLIKLIRERGKFSIKHSDILYKCNKTTIKGMSKGEKIEIILLTIPHISVLTLSCQYYATRLACEIQPTQNFFDRMH